MSKKKKAKSPKKPLRRETKPTNRRFLILLGCIPALLALLIYANTLGHDYALDDYSAIKENYVTKKGLAGLGDIFTKHYRFGYWNSKGTLYRPVSLAMFAVEWEIAPDKPGFYHFINVFLFACTGFLLFWTVLKLFPRGGPLLALLTSILFVSHPIHVEVVANIKSRDEILAFLFGILAIYALWKYFAKQQISWLIGALAAYTVALFSKETAITFLAVFPLVAYFGRKESLVKSLLPALAFLLPALIYLSTRAKVLGDVFAGSSEISKLDNVLAGATSKIAALPTALMIGGKYLKNMILPHPLGSDFGFNQIPLTGWGDWRVLLSLLLFVGMVLVALRLFTKRSPISFGLLFFGITFSIFSNLLIWIGTSYGDRLMYTPSFGIILALVAALIYFLKVDTTKKTTNGSAFFKAYQLPILIVGAVALLYSFKTVDRNRAWKDSFTLYDTDISAAPNSAKLNYHYGLELNKKGLDAGAASTKASWWDKAMLHFNRAVEIDPTYADAYGQLGLMYYRQKDYPKAMENYNKSLQFKQNNAKVYSNMGIIFFEQGNLNKAREVYEKAISIDPRFVDARRNLGSVYAQMKQFDQAILHFKEALKYEPNNATINLYLGFVYRDKGDNATSQQYLNRAYQLDPSLRQ